MVRQLEADGIWTEMTDEEARQTMSEQAWRILTAPKRDPETLTEGQRALYERMQAEAEASAAMSAAGLTIDDLPVEGEMEEVGDGHSDVGSRHSLDPERRVDDTQSQHVLLTGQQVQRQQGQ